jgi:hypothetical protein
MKYDCSYSIHCHLKTPFLELLKYNWYESVADKQLHQFGRSSLQQYKAHVQKKSREAGMVLSIFYL